VKTIAIRHLARVHAKITDLTKLERVLTVTIECCSGD
jgi:hypothetical protein